MNRKILLLSILAFLALTWFSACSKDDDEPQPAPEPVPEFKGAPLNVLIVFSPGQLGDNGYADRVFNGIQMLKALYERNLTDTLDVNFISTYSRDATRETMMSWVRNTHNPFYENDYQRRLLVLTEPFMIEWLDDIKDSLRTTDDVLMLKTSEALIDEYAESTGLGDRLYGMNISAADAIWKFCVYADSTISWAYQDTGREFINHDVLPIYRLYGNEEVDYQDSILIMLRERWGPEEDANGDNVVLIDTAGHETIIETTPLSSNDGEGIYAADGISSTTMAYSMAENMGIYAQDLGHYFTIIDIGSAITGWNYYLFADEHNKYISLHLDGSSNTLCTYYVSRLFDYALMMWTISWIKNQEIPKMTWHGAWDNCCTDNLPEMY